MATPQLYQPEETHALIQERAKLNSDRFKIHVWRRPLSGGQLMQVAGVDGATVDHISDPGRWLPPLMGGGEYVMHVFHSTEQPSVRIGGPLPVTFDSKQGSPFGLPRQYPNLKAMTNAAWTGPTILTYPPMDLMTEDQQPLVGATSKTGLAMVAGSGLPPQPAVVPDPNVAYQLSQLAEREREVARREKEAAEKEVRTSRELTEQREENKRMASESKLRDELRSAQNETKATLDRLMTQVSAPKPESGAGVEKILTALAPMATMLIQGMNESRNMMMKLQEDAARRREEAEDRRATEAREAAKQTAQTQLEIAKISAVKPGMSEEMKMLLDTLKAEKSNSSTAAMTEMMSGMINAMGTVTKMSINMIETVADQMGGDPEDPVVTAIKEGTKAMMMLTQGSQNASRSIVPQKPAVQAQPPRQQQRPPITPAATQQKPSIPPNIPVGATATGPQATAPGVPVAGPAQAVPVVPVPVFSKTDLLEQAIRGQQPPEAVARVLVALIAQKEASLGVELAKHEGNPNKVLYARLGETWVENNLSYLNELGAQFDQQGSDAGIFTDDAEGSEALTAEPEAAPVNGVPEAVVAPSPAEVTAEG